MKLQKYLSPKVKRHIFNSIWYRLYKRYQIKDKTVRFSVELTTKCNASCLMCTRLKMIKNNLLSINDINEITIKKIIKEMKKFIEEGYKVEFVPMGLGEPLLYKNIFKLIERVNKTSLDIKIILVTNGILLNRENVKKLLKLKVDEICVSLNSTDRQGYKKCMGIDKYDEVKANISNLIRTRNKTQKYRTQIYIQFLSFGPNTKVLEKEIRLWNKILIDNDKCFIHPIVNQAGFCETKISKVKKKKYPCTSSLKRVAIKVNGDMYPCDPCFYGGETKIDDLYLGNINKESWFSLIKNKNSKIYKIVDNMRKNKYGCLKTCKRCNTCFLSTNTFFKMPKFIKSEYRWW